MQKTAVIELAGHQYLVKEGDKITIDKHLEDKKTLKIDEVLLMIDDTKTIIGNPFVKSASVSLSIDSLIKGKKINVQRFRAKSRYRLKKGHRQPQTILTVTKIS